MSLPRTATSLRSTRIPTDSYSLIVMGLAAVVVVWLVFSMARKLFGLVLVGALALGGFMVWNNPEALESVIGAATVFLGS